MLATPPPFPCFPQTLEEEEESASNMADVEKMATTVLGSGKEQFYPALLHLVVADSAYCDANKDTGGGQWVEGTCVHTLVYTSAVCVCVCAMYSSYAHAHNTQHLLLKLTTHAVSAAAQSLTPHTSYSTCLVQYVVQ